MRYFNNHRRKLIKQNYIRGTKATAQGTKKLELESTVNLPPIFLQIQGRTGQNQYSGYNLFDANSAILSGCTLNDDGSISLNTSGACVDIPLPAGKYIISLERDFTSGSTWLRNGKVGSGYIVRLDTEGETSLAKSFVFDASYDGYLRMQIYATGTISNIQIALGEEVKPYEPYVGGGVSPNPNYPQPIEAVSDMEITVRGLNLMNPALYRQYAYTYGGIALKGQGDEVVMTGTATTSIYNSILSTPDKTIALPETMRGKTLYISAYETGLYNNVPVEFGFYNDENSGMFFVTDATKGVRSLDVPSDRTKWWIRFRFTKGKTYDERFKIIISDTPHTEYEPYKEPVIIPVNNGELAGIDGYQDILKLDFANKSAKKIERILYANVSDLIEDYGCEFDGHACFTIPNVPPRMNDENANPYTYYCTHFTSYHNDSTIDANNPRFELGSSELYFYFTGHNTVSDFRQWCLDNDVKIAYVPLQEQQIDITGSEIGQCLLNLKLPESETVIFEVNSSVPPTSLSLEYYSKTKEDIYILTVRYEDREGNVLLESKTSSVRSGSRYKVVAPEIEGYMPICAEYEGYMNNDNEIVIKYSSI